MARRRTWSIDELRSELSSLGADQELVNLAGRLGDLRREAASPSALDSIWAQIETRASAEADGSNASQPGASVEAVSSDDSPSSEKASGR